MIYEKIKPVFDAKIFVGEINGAKCHSLRAFYTQVAKAMHFPEYFGKNLDGLEECLTDLSWLNKSAAALIIHNAPEFLNKETVEKRETVLDIFKILADEPGEVPLKIVFLEK
jgi:RNAse (barnase) inhibitor barstar